MAFFGDALFTPFISLYLVSLGLGSLQKGIILGILPLGSFLGNYFYSFFSGGFKRNKRLLKIISLVEIAFILGSAFTSDFYLLIFTVFFSSFNNSSYFQIQDGTSIISLKREKKTFNQVRIFGSLGYALALLGGYFVLEKVAYNILFSISALCFLLVFFLLLFVKDEETDSERGDEKKEKGRFVKEFWLYLAFYVLLFGSLNCEGFIFPIFYKGEGISDSFYSLFNFFKTGLEIIIIVLYKPLKKIFKSNLGLLLIASLMAIGSSLCAGLISDSYLSIGFSFALRGICSGLIIVSMVEALNEILGANKTARGLTLTIGSMNLFTGIFNFVFTYALSENYYKMDFLMLFGLQILGVICLIIIKKVSKNKSLD